MSPEQQDSRAERRGRREETGTSAYTHPSRVLGDGVRARARLTPLTLHVELAILIALSLSYLCRNKQELLCCSTVLNVWSERWTSMATWQQDARWIPFIVRLGMYTVLSSLASPILSG